HLLQSLDLAEPVDFVDPQGGGDYFSAGTALSKAVDANGGDGNASVAAIPYFEHLFPFMANRQFVDYNGNLVYDGTGQSATQNIYALEWAPQRSYLGATTSLADIDFYCGDYGVTYCPDGYQSKFWQQQFASLYALSTIGMSSYNALQVSLRHAMTHGLQFDVNYTLSKTIDMGSDAERTSEFSAAGTAVAASAIQNTWKPYLNRAVADFDTRHLVTVDAVWQLPIGKGKALLGNSGPVVNSLLGGWQYSGIFRTTSGLPFSLFEPGYTTNWQQPAYGVVTDPSLKAHKHIDAAGNVTFFDNPDAINAGITSGGPVRLPYPGEAGERNYFRGDGYLDLDSSLSKAFQFKEYGALAFTWSVYNVTNTVRFDPFSVGSQLSGGNLGTASAVLGGNQTPRRVQFALRYDF
ncbi:MAG: hypothetical protein INR62_11955, partial [Rhodospirillales bacterium]|nr:hypothetical protein [Acetobacter sp.]